MHLHLPSSITESIGCQFHKCVLLLPRTLVLVRGPAPSHTRGYADANLLAFPACNYAAVTQSAPQGQSDRPGVFHPEPANRIQLTSRQRREGSRRAPGLGCATPLPVHAFGVGGGPPYGSPPEGLVAVRMVFAVACAAAAIVSPIRSRGESGNASAMAAMRPWVRAS